MVSRILGPDGQPIQMAEIREPQTARIAQLHREFQNHPSRGLTPSRLAQILQGAEQGDPIAQYELFEDMEEKDGHILSEMGKRRRAVTLLDWDIVPPANPSAREKDAAKRLREVVEEIADFEEVLFDTTDAIGKGFVNLEIEWHRLDGVWLPKTITHRPQSWFVLHRGYRQEIRLRDHASPDGAPLQPFGWITHTHRAKSGYIERAALFRSLVWPYLFKNYAVADLAEFLEIYGIPLRLGKYPPGASEKEKATLLRALVNVGHNAAGIVPDGMAIDFHDAADGDPKAFELMIDWCERTTSKVILGATLTSQADRGSNTNALGNVHNEVRKDLRDSDAKQVAATLTRDLVYSIAALNGLAPDGIRRCPRMRIDTAETEDIKTFADALPALVKIGTRIPRKWAQEQLGIPEPEGDEEVLAIAAEPTPALAAEPAPVASARAQLDDGREALVAAAVDRLEREAEAPMGEWIDTVRQLLAQASSFDEFREGLLALNLPPERMAELMRDALVTTELAGRGEVADEARHAQG